jgi:hypothetical protein
MNYSNSPLSVGEFQRSMQALERMVQAGFERTDDRLERIESAQGEHGERIAVLEGGRKAQARRAAGWSTLIVSGGVAVVEAVRRYYKP